MEIVRQRPLLLLFDGNALIHRAFHAIQQPLTVTRTGEVVTAVYGFANTLLKVLSELKPDCVAVAFDRPTPTFRHELSEGYKAQRPSAPAELVGQFDRVRQLVRAFNIPIFERDGYEADDLLGALSLKATESDIDTIIVTGDLDTLQLVSPQVRVLTPRGHLIGDMVYYDEAAIEKRYGLAPSQIADLKALMGDSSDNIPGVSGIGAKTAARLLRQFGSLAGIYSHLEEVAPPHIRETLRTNEESAQRSKELATIVSDIPIALDLEACRLSDYERERVAALFQELEFSSLLRKLNDLPPPQRQEQLWFPGMEVKAKKQGAAKALEARYRIVDTAEALEELAAKLSAAPSVVFDVETTDIDPMRANVVGISLSPVPGEAYYVPVGHTAGRQLPLTEVVEKIGPSLRNEAISRVAHNGKYDMAVMANNCLDVSDLRFDTMIAAHLLGERALGLKDLAFHRLGVEMAPISALIGSGAKQISMAQVAVGQVADYCCAHADMTGRLAELFEGELKEKGLWQLFTDVEMPLVSVLLRMEMNGVALDTASLRRMSQEFGRQIAELESRIYECVGHRFNINSTQQLGPILFDDLRLPRSRRTKSGYSTDASVLEGLRGAHPIIELLLEYRQLAKLKSTYVDALPALINPRTGRVHTSFNQTGTVTGRLSSSAPNLQNIPIRTELGRAVREAFVAGGGRDWALLSADYSQVDLRVLAHLSQDPRLLAAFRADEDIHAATASEVFGVALDEVTPDMRRVAKTVNFGVIYGMGEFGLAQGTGLSREEAARFINAYFEKYEGVKEYLAATRRKAWAEGYVQTLLGRRRYIPEIYSASPRIRSAAERMAVNMPVQGTAADIIKVAMIQLQRRIDGRGMDSKMVLQVHDELLFEVPTAELEEMKALAKETMSQAVELSIPLKVDLKVGKNWGEVG